MYWPLVFDEALESVVILMYGWHFEVDILFIELSALGNVGFRAIILRSFG